MTAQETDGAAPFRILTVCTGNLCRSPLAAGLLQAGFDTVALGWFQVTSAGTRATPGRAMESRTAAALTSLGGSPAGFVSLQLTERILVQQDLVLALTREHRGNVVEVSPGLLGRAFTLRELARLLPAVPSVLSASPAERWRTVAAQAVRARTPHPDSPADDDVVDPYRRDDEVFAQMLTELTSAVDSLLEWERGRD